MFKQLLLAVLAASSALALSSHHAARDSHGHQALAARFASSHQNITAPARFKRADSKRCKARTTTSESTTTSTSSTVEETPTSTWTPEPTSTEVQETTTSQWIPDPVTWLPTSEPSPSPSPSPTDSGNNGGGDGGFMSGTNNGQATFYDRKPCILSIKNFLANTRSSAGLGACGITNGPGDYIAAASHLLFDSYPYAYHSAL
jgi:hypothetical protein